MISSTFASSTIRSDFSGPAPGRNTRTFPPTSCIMSLSLVTMETSRPFFAPCLASAPITSSASKPSNSRIGKRIASQSRRT